MITGRQHDPERVRLALLACIHAVMCVVSLISVAHYRYPLSFDPYRFHIFFDTIRLPFAIMTVAVFGLLVSLFVFTRFSFGYFVAFYCYTMVLGYVWLNNFTDLVYDHRLAAFSAAASAIAFMLPTLFISAPIRQVFVLSERGFDRLLLAILLISVAIVLSGASYNFRLVGVEHIYEFRDKLKLPILLSYLTGIVGSTLLPFVFAGFLARRAFPWALASLFLILCLYPITLSKLNLLAPLWLVGFFILSQIVEARTAVMLSLLLPITAILVLAALFGQKVALLVSIVNFRMIAIPSVAIDVYSDFFSRQPLTHFCQVSFLKPLMDCPYRKCSRW